jgi:predicted NodU family carbamoyl transferase
VARGYLHRPDLTAEKFGPDPFSHRPGARLYKTGDLARFRPDGRIEYLGRLDQQVKVRGFRIELGEIEARLRDHPDVREAVVVARQESADDLRLIAYVVAASSPGPRPESLRAYLEERLPEYMLPAAYVELAEMPLIDRIADDLAAGRLVGWMEGACEFGPRALGHRSLLAAPHDAAIRDRLNRDIKRREEFRPFAPVVPIESADRFFDLPAGGARLGRFMSGVFAVRPEWRSRLAAVTHIDGTARVQVLERAMAPRLHGLLEAYGRRGGVPVLLNTSFNVAGEPIVTQALEGYLTFRRCGIDVLVAGAIVVTRRTAAPSLKESRQWSSSSVAASTVA